jgi:hypothetical protein
VVPVWPDQPSAGGGAASAGGGAGSAIDEAGAGGGAMSGGLDLLQSTRLSAPANVRAFLTAGGADPRLVAVLESSLANHSIGLGQITALTDPVHVQAVSIVSVDGQPVGPGNFAARDLVTEIAALDQSLRPNEIGSPWPIHSPGFFSDPGQQAQLHLAFVSAADYEPQAGVVAPGGAVAPEASVVPAGTVAPEASVAPDVASAPAGAVAPAPDVAVAPSPAGGAAGAVQTSGHYVDPLPDSARIGRTDMGVDVDLTPGDPIVAPGASRVVGIMPNWYQGQPYVALQLLDGPMKGHNYYIAEQITPSVSVGQVVQQGQPIGHYAASGTGIEMGWAGSNWERTLAQETGHDNADMGDHANTPAGISFRNFLNGLGHGGASSGAGPTDVPGAAAGGAPSTDPEGVPSGDPDAAPSGAPDAAAPVPSAPAVSPAPSAPSAPVAPAVESAESVPQAISAPAPQPSAVAFDAHGVRGSGRHTVQFLPAVRPGPESPLYGQAPRVAAPAAAVTPAPAPEVTPAPAEAAQPASAAATPAPGAAGLLDQAPGAPATTGGAITVSSSLLTPGQAKFAGRLAELTGLDPHVVAAWELAEESGSAAQGREAASNFNWLNIGYFDSGAGKIAFDKTFSDPISAAEQSAKFLKGDWGGASPSIRAILNSVGHSPDEQMAAIANSDWASSHYGGGANLHGTYNELGDIHIEKSTAA